MAVSTNIDSMAMEINNLIDQQRQMNGLLSDWTRGGGTNPYFNLMTANEGNFNSPPLEFARLRRITGDTSVASATSHDIAFNDNSGLNTGLIDHSTVAGESTRIFFPTADASQKVVLLTGYVSLNDASTAGDVLIHANLWKPDGTSNGTVTMNRQQNPRVASFQHYPFAFPVRFHSSITSISIGITQDSGSSFLIQEAWLGMLRVF